MAGNKVGGKKAAATNKRLYGMNFYDLIGKKGGLTDNGGRVLKGFANPNHYPKASAAGVKGGIVRGDMYRTHNKQPNN